MNTGSAVLLIVLLMVLNGAATFGQDVDESEAAGAPLQSGAEDGAENVAAPPTQLERGQAALEADRPEQAVAEFRLAVEQSPESAAARVGLGSALAALRRNDEAIEQFERAAELDPDDPEPLLLMGRVLVAERRLDEALARYRQAIERDPESEPARLSAAQLLHRQRRFVELVAHLEAAREALPASGRVTYGLAWMLAASPDASLRDGERALELAKTVFESEQLLQNAELVAEAMAELDRCDEAADWMRGFADSIADSEPPDALVERLLESVERFERERPCRAATENSDPAGS